MSDSRRQLLPQNVKPLHYALQFALPDLEEGFFHGEVGMDLCIKVDSAHITVNALELVITSASIDAIEAYKIDFDEEYQTATLHWNKIWNRT